MSPSKQLEKIKQQKGEKREETEKVAANDFTDILLKYGLQRRVENYFK